MKNSDIKGRMHSVIAIKEIKQHPGFCYFCRISVSGERLTDLQLLIILRNNRAFEATLKAGFKD